MELLSERNGSVIVGHLAGSSANRARQRDAVVDVEDTGAAAGRPDDCRGLDSILLGVHLAEGQRTATSSGHAGSLLYEVIGLYLRHERVQYGLTVLPASWEK